MGGFRGVVVALVGLITLALVAPWGVPKAVADDGDRLGCNTFCQNAGGYGAAGPAPLPSPITIVSGGTVTADADGYVPVTLTCNATAQCTGALLVDLDSPAAKDALGYDMTNYGRSDLVVNAGATRTIGVPLPAPALAYLRSNSPTSLGVVAVTISTGQPYAHAVAELTVAAPG
jgi:hypothetical protein